MALNAACVWEVRTTGSDNNGGAFKAGASGTDRSQQDAAQVAIDNATITTSITTNVITFTGGYSPTSADVGNVVQMLTGTNVTAGFYEITSISAGVSWTVDRNVVTSGTTTNATGNMGGALASAGKCAGAKAAGNDVWLKSGTYSVTTASSNVSNGVVNESTGGVSQSDHSWWRGYHTSRWSNVPTSTDLANPPILQLSGAVSSCTVFTLAANRIGLANIKVDGASKTSCKGFAYSNSAYSQLTYLTAINCTSGGFDLGQNYGDNCQVAFLYASGCGGTAAILSYATLFACIAISNTTTGISLSNGASAIGCISASNTGASSDGFTGAQVDLLIYNCVAYSNGRHGVNINTGGFGGDGVAVINTIAVNNSGYGFGGSTTQDGAIILGCAAYNNTSGALQPSSVGLGGSITTLTGDPFTNAASGDFSLNNTAGAGAACRAAGIPGAFPGASTTGYLDIGAAQHQDSGSGGAIILSGLGQIGVGVS